MLGFISSPIFLLACAGAGALYIMYRLLQANIHWLSRDITPAAQVQAQQNRTRWLSKGAWARILGGLALLYILLHYGPGLLAGVASMSEPKPLAMVRHSFLHAGWIVLAIFGVTIILFLFKPTKTWVKENAKLFALMWAIIFLLAGLEYWQPVWFGDVATATTATSTSTATATVQVPATLKLPVVTDKEDVGQYLPVDIPPGGETDRIVPSNGQHVVIMGDRWQMLTTFADKSTCTSDDPGCDASRHGTIVSVHVLNPDKYKKTTVFLGFM